MVNINQIDDWLDEAQLICIETDGKTKYDFNSFTFPFASKIYHHNLTLQEAKDDVQELKILMNKLNNDYHSSNQIKINEKDNTLKSAKKFFGIREKIINAFKKGIFPYTDGFQVKTDEETDKKTDEETNEETDTTGMSELESEQSAAQRNKQIASGLKILTPNQMLSRLPISLPQLNAGNSSEKLKKKIRRILYPLYRSKKLTATIYKSLIDII